MPTDRQAGALGIASVLAAGLGTGMPATAHADIYAATTAGKRLAEVHCVGCHAVGTVDEEPRHDRLPTLRGLAPRIGADPEKYRLFLTNPHHEMAAVSLDRTEIEALLAYIVSLQQAR